MGRFKRITLFSIMTLLLISCSHAEAETPHLNESSDNDIEQSETIADDQSDEAGGSDEEADDDDEHETKETSPKSDEKEDKAKEQKEAISKSDRDEKESNKDSSKQKEKKPSTTQKETNDTSSKSKDTNNKAVNDSKQTESNSKENVNNKKEQEQKKVIGTVTLSVVDPDGVGGPTFGPKEVEITSGATALDVLLKTGFDVRYTGNGSTAYVVGVEELKEFDEGPFSGWLFKVDGVEASVSAGAFELKPGQKVEWIYTTDWITN